MTVRTAVLAAAVAALGLAAPQVASADWPVYGHDLANTRDAGKDGPAAKDLPGLEQAWSFQSPTGDFTGTPAVAGGVVVAGDHAGVVYALDAVTGKVLWSKDVGEEINGSAAIDLDAPGGPTAYVPVAELDAPRLIALSLADGATRWDTVLTKQPGGYVYGSPTFWKGTLYIGTSGPNNDDATARGSLVALDEADGKIRWQTFMVPPGRDGAAVWTTPAIDTATGRLYVGTGNNYHEPATELGDAMVALDAETGAVLGHYQATPNDTFAPDNLTSGPDYDFGSSPNLIEGPNGEQLVGEGQKSGIYWALDRATMQPVWRTTVGPGGYLGGILGSTAYDGTRVYGADALDGTVFALGRDGKKAWTASDTPATHFGPTTVANGVVYTMDPSGSVVARDPKTGAELARLSLGAPAFGGLSADGGALYVSVGTGPPPSPAPQEDGPGKIVAFGDTSRSGPGPNPPGTSRHRQRIRLTVRPRRVRVHRRVVIRFSTRRRASQARGPVARVKIRLAGHAVRTNKRGRARMALRFRRPGLYHVRAGKRGVVTAHVPVRALRRRG